MLLRGRRRAPLGSSGSDGGARGEIKNCFEYQCSFVYVRICWSLPMDISGFRAGSDFHKFEIWLHWSLFCQLFLLDTNGILASLLEDSQGDLLDVRFFCAHYFVNCDLRQKRSILNWFWHQCLAFKKSYWYSYISQNVKNHISENFKIHFLCVVCVFVKGGRRERKTCSQIPCWKVHCFATYHASYASIIQFSCQPSSDHTFISFSNINSACNGKRNL